MSWIGVDLDGTLAHYDGWPKDGSIGEPILPMVNRVKGWISEGKEIRIFTARVWPMGTRDQTHAEKENAEEKHKTDWREALLQNDRIQTWLEKHFGHTIPCVCVKDKQMVALYDDRCVQVERNTGRIIE